MFWNMVLGKSWASTGEVHSMSNIAIPAPSSTTLWTCVWPSNGCPDGATVIIAPQVPPGLFQFLGEGVHADLREGLGGLQSPLWACLMLEIAHLGFRVQFWLSKNRKCSPIPKCSLFQWDLNSSCFPWLSFSWGCCVHLVPALRDSWKPLFSGRADLMSRPNGSAAILETPCTSSCGCAGPLQGQLDPPGKGKSTWVLTVLQLLQHHQDKPKPRLYPHNNLADVIKFWVWVICSKTSTSSTEMS